MWYPYPISARQLPKLQGSGGEIAVSTDVDADIVGFLPHGRDCENEASFRFVSVQVLKIIEKTGREFAARGETVALGPMRWIGGVPGLMRALRGSRGSAPDIPAYNVHTDLYSLVRGRTW